MNRAILLKKEGRQSESLITCTWVQNFEMCGWGSVNSHDTNIYWWAILNNCFKIFFCSYLFYRMVSVRCWETSKLKMKWLMEIWLLVHTKQNEKLMKNKSWKKYKYIFFQVCTPHTHLYTPWDILYMLLFHGLILYISSSLQ